MLLTGYHAKTMLALWQAMMLAATSDVATFSFMGNRITALSESEAHRERRGTPMTTRLRVL